MLNSLSDVADFRVNEPRFLSATHEEIYSGLTTDVYFVNTRDVLASVGRLDVPIVAEIFTRKSGICAGRGEVLE